MNLYKRACAVRELLSDKILQLQYWNKPHIEYYRAIMRREARIDPRAAVGGGDGHQQLERLITHGLDPNHSLLDIGCGCLRGGLSIIEYLGNGKYTGNDISQELLDVAAIYIKKAGLDTKNPTILFTNSLDLKEVRGKTFDYVHAQGVFSQMPPEDIEIFLSHVQNVMHVNTIFLASFFLSKNGTIYATRTRRNFFYPFSWFENVSAKYGLKAELAKVAIPQKHALLVIKKSD